VEVIHVDRQTRNGVEEPAQAQSVDLGGRREAHRHCPSTLSRIENDQISPTYDMLLRLGRGLSIDLSQLLSAAQAEVPSDQAGRRSVNRILDGEMVPMPNHTLRYLSNDLLNKQMTPILSEYRARSLEEFGP